MFCSNSQSILEPLDRIVSKVNSACFLPCFLCFCAPASICSLRSPSFALLQAYDMFANSGYLHHYYKHGMEKAHFTAAFAKLEQLIGNYQSLSK